MAGVNGLVPRAATLGVARATGFLGRPLLHHGDSTISLSILCGATTLSRTTRFPIRP
jgi:hypothetical protein